MNDRHRHLGPFGEAATLRRALRWAYFWVAVFALTTFALAGCCVVLGNEKALIERGTR